MGKDKERRKALLNKAVSAAIARKDIDYLCYLVQHEGVNPNKVPEHSSLLHVAVQLESPALLSFLMTVPHIELCKKDSGGHSALELALTKHTSMTPLLLTNAGVISQECPFHALVATVQPAKRIKSHTKQILQSLEFIRSTGAKLPCSCFKRPLCHKALSKQNAYFLNALLQAGGDPNEIDNHGQSLLFAAAKMAHLPSIRTVIIRGGYTWNQENQDIACDEGVSSEVKTFIRELTKRRAVYYILKLRNVGAKMFTVLSFWLLKEIIALV